MSPPPPPDSAGPAEGLDWTGRVIAGRYRVDSVLGVGGMGTAYRAYDQKLERAVVLKVPHARHFSAGESRGRFQDEIRKLIAIEHPHVVKVHDVDDEAGTPYAVFPYLAGGNLAARMKASGAPLAPEEVVPWLVQIADALDDLHEHGDIHRDVKPDNILSDKPLGKGKANAYLADFGLAKALGLDPARLFQSRTGTLIGTQAYMAPEQFTPQGMVTGAVDQYALATTVYQALSAETPFAVSSAEELAVAKAMGTPRPLAQVTKNIAPGVDRAVMRALSANPKSRFGTCAEFARTLAMGAQAGPAGTLAVPRVRRAKTKAPKNLLPPASGPKTPLQVASRAPETVRSEEAAHPGRHTWRARWISAALLTLAGLGGSGAFLGWFGGEATAPSHRGAVPEAPPVSALADGMDLLRAIPSTVEPPAMQAGPSPASMEAASSAESAMEVSPPVPAMKDSVPAAALTESQLPATPEWAKVAPDQIAEAKRLKVPVAFENSIGMRFVLVPAGTFTMGSPDGEQGRDADEAQHAVTLTQCSYVSIYETTNGQYRRFKRDHDSGDSGGESLNGDTQPVANVSHAEATAFAAWLTAQETERSYRLPTESEWEYAARAKTTAQRYWGDDEGGFVRNANIADAKAQAKFGFSWSRSWDDGFAATAPVGTYLPNGWGLYDMIGNVSEWCFDLYGRDYPMGAVIDPTGFVSGAFRVLRGGSWFNAPDSERAAYRLNSVPDAHLGGSGFRLVVPVRTAR